MNIGFIGGRLNGSYDELIIKENFAPPFIYKSLDSEKTHWNKIELYKQKRFDEDGSVFDIYNLMMIRRQGEIKPFYVLKGLSRSEVELNLDKCWHKSDLIGFDFE
jgi:hypothetical protein